MRELNLNKEFSILLSLICEAIVEFRAYDLRKIAVSISPSKGQSTFGTWAYVVALRENGGKPFRRAMKWGIPGLYTFDCRHLEKVQPEACYLMTFLVPKFFKLSPEQRLETLVHELYHLHPTLRGDLRRFPRPHIHHGPTPKQFKNKVISLCQEAKSNFPEILQHPLLASDISENHRNLRRQHLPIPKRIFKPLSFFAWVALIWGSFAMAQEINVKVQKDATLYTSPNIRSAEKALVGPTDALKATKLNFDRTWVYVIGEGNEGWVPRHLLNVVTNEGKVMNADNQGTAPTPPEAAATEPGIAVANTPPPAPDGDEEFVDKAEEELKKQEDPLPDSASAKNNFKFYENADANSKQFGEIEKGDSLDILDANKERTWYQVRLPVTGEEGWVKKESLDLPQDQAAPAASAGPTDNSEEEITAPSFEEDDLEASLSDSPKEEAKVETSQSRNPHSEIRRHYLGPEIAYATKGLKLGLGLSYHFSFMNSDNPNLRYELGPRFGYYFGRKVEDELNNVTSSSFLLFDLDARLVLDNVLSKLGVSIGAGLAHLRPRITQKDSNGDEVAVESNSAKAQTGIGVSGHVHLPLAEHFLFEVGARGYLTKTKFISFGGSLIWNF